MCNMYKLDCKEQELHILKKKITVLRDELKPFVDDEQFDIEECLRLSKLLDECVIGYMTINKIVS